MSREAAGAAIRALRESRDWSLADLASATGVSIMGLSYLERGARKPHKGTVQKVENGLGLPPGTYSRLVLSDDPDAELAQLLAAPDPNAVRTRSAAAPVPVQRHQDTDVLEAHAEAHLESLNSLITRLPTETSNEYESYIASVIAQCVKAELLAANSWRVAVPGSGESARRLMAHLKALENLRAGLLARLPGSMSARFDRACRESGLPEAVVAAMLGMSIDDVWAMRNSGVVPAGALARVRAFVDGELC
ncbi:MAG: helix-turn-helix domain-containing protein [Mycobacterium sp.]